MSHFGQPVLPVTERGRATRQAILDAAKESIAELGYDQASVAEITRRAGVAQGTFYVHFEDKAAVFLELVRQVNHDVRRLAAQASAQGGTRYEQERAGFAAFFSRIVEDPGVYRIIRESEFVDRAIHQAHYERLAAPYAEGLREAMAAGDISADIDPELLAYILMGIAEFMGMKLVLWEQKDVDPVAFEQLMTFVQRGMGAKR
jgi:AcrR family transcriptional regulator